MLRKRTRMAFVGLALAAAAVTLGLTGCKTLVAPLPALAPGPPPAAPDLALIAAVLANSVDAEGNVDYAALEREPEDLERAYAQVAAVSPDSHPELFPTEADRLAYWINAYNVATLASVVRLYPLESVADLGPPWYLWFLRDTAGFFYFRQSVFGGERFDLYTLENEVVRARFDDPRFHFALNCASAGCPRLPREPFDPGRLDAQLDRETRRFFAEPRNLTIDAEARVVWLSQILEWYAEDYVDGAVETVGLRAGLLDFVAPYAPAEAAALLRGPAAEYELRFVPYDWRLNDVGQSRYPVPGGPAVVDARGGALGSG